MPALTPRNENFLRTRTLSCSPPPVMTAARARSCSGLTPTATKYSSMEPAARAWIKNLQRDPHVALGNLRSAGAVSPCIGSGTVTQITDYGADEHYGTLAQKYRGYTPEEYKQRPNYASADRHRTLVRIRPDRVIAWTNG